MSLLVAFGFGSRGGEGVGDHDHNTAAKLDQLADMRIQHDRGRIQAGEVYGLLLTQGPNADLYAGLGNLFFDEDRPIQALFYFDLAQSLKPENSVIKEDRNRVLQHLEHLEKKFETYNTELLKGQDLSRFNSMATIKFHMGYHNEAFGILNNALSMFGEDQRISSLVSTFKQGLDVQARVLAKLRGNYDQALGAADYKKALEYFGEMVFFSLGHPKVIPILGDLQKAAPALVNQESLELLKEFSLTYPDKEKED